VTPNQVIAYNLREARRQHGWTQERAAAELEPYLGTRWSVPVFSAAERSVAGERIREFSADDVHALSRAFNLPITFFFRPPPNAYAIVHGHASWAHTGGTAASKPGESPVDFFARVIELDRPENAWLLKWLDDAPRHVREAIRLKLDERAVRATQNALAHELYPLTEWAERLHDMGNQLESVRDIVESESRDS
jgi:transcriptional regulator with XRE-family HTH domain